jgi:hypothetical protein
MRLSTEKVAQIGLLGGWDGVDDRCANMLKEIPLIKPGNVIDVYPGLTIRVHESYVDPREKEPYWNENALRGLHKRWRADYPDFEEFEKRIRSLTENTS